MDKTYKVTKVKVSRENSDKFVKEDYTITGEVSNLEVGDSMVVISNKGFNSITTSPIEEIGAANSKGNFMVKTRNSVYSLELVVD